MLVTPIVPKHIKRSKETPGYKSILEASQCERLYDKRGFEQSYSYYFNASYQFRQQYSGLQGMSRWGVIWSSNKT